MKIGIDLGPLHLFIHLWRDKPEEVEQEPHEGHQFAIGSPGAGTEVAYTDPERFGF